MSEKYYKIYIASSALLCSLLFLWLGHNCLVYNSYKSSFQIAKDDYKKIALLESKIPQNPQKEQEYATIEKTLTFFKRSVPGIVPDYVKKTNQNNKAPRKEFMYDIKFSTINRQELARYIFYIKKSAMSLNIKLVVANLEMVKIENLEGSADQWKVQLQFIHRLL